MGGRLLQDIGPFKELSPEELEQLSATGTARTFNLQTAVERARACPAGRARQGARTQRTSVRKDEQRRKARPAGCDRVRSGLTQMVSLVVARLLRVHANFQRYSSGHLPFVGSIFCRQGSNRLAIPADGPPLGPGIRLLERIAPDRPFRYALGRWQCPANFSNSDTRDRA